jgi:hypothetical protein
VSSASAHNLIYNCNCSTFLLRLQENKILLQNNMKSGEIKWPFLLIHIRQFHHQIPVICIKKNEIPKQKEQNSHRDEAWVWHLKITCIDNNVIAMLKQALALYLKYLEFRFPSQAVLYLYVHHCLLIPNQPQLVSIVQKWYISTMTSLLVSDS